MAPCDTSSIARDVYWRRLAEMSPSERIDIGAALWEAGHHFLWARIRRGFPDADEAEIAFRMAEAKFGPELARKIYGRQ